MTYLLIILGKIQNDGTKGFEFYAIICILFCESIVDFPYVVEMGFHTLDLLYFNSNDMSRFNH